MLFVACPPLVCVLESSGLSQCVFVSDSRQEPNEATEGSGRALGSYGRVGDPAIGALSHRSFVGWEGHPPTEIGDGLVFRGYLDFPLICRTLPRSPSSARLPFFGWEGSLTIDYTEKSWYQLILTSQIWRT